MANSQEHPSFSIGACPDPMASLVQKRYTYRTFETHQHIRLLVVKAGQNFEDGLYEIITTPLEQAPPYDAVSYTWGLAERNHQLNLADGSFLPITGSLLPCLPLLAKVCSTGYLWIDQICIDQMNGAERSHQVTLMPEIYRRAAQVTVYLQVIGFMNLEHLKAVPDVTMEHEAAGKPVGQLLNHIRETNYPCSKRPNSKAALLQAALRIFQHPWFRRAWIFQEIILSKYQRFLLGSTIVPFPRLLYLALEIMSIWDKERPENPSLELQQTMAGIYQLYVMAQVMVERGRVLPRTNFWDLLSVITPNSHCSPGSLVFAFQGLLDDTRFALVPGSTSSEKDFFIKVAANYLRITHNLDILSKIDRGHDKCQRIPGLPSWVPDRNLPEETLPISYLTCPGAFSAAACRLYEADEYNPTDLGRLPARGKIVDKIARLSPALIRRNPLWFMNHDLPFDQNFKSYLERIAWNRVVVITENGRLGFAHWSAQMGDTACILHGSSSPVVLRQVSDTEFKVIGQAFIFGLMHGEAVTWEEKDADTFILV